MPTATPLLTRKLPNGLTLIAQENHSAPVVALQMFVNIGAADETDVEGGIAHVHEHMLFKGTTSRPVGQISRDVEAAGGDVNAYTSHDQTVYHITLAREFMDQGIDILADILLNSTFDESELVKEIRVIADEEIKRGKDMPSRHVQEDLFALAFTKHTYGRPVIGYDEVVRKFSREMILSFYRRFYRPENVTFVLTGDFDAEAALALAEKHFGPMVGAPLEPGARTVTRPRPVEPEQTAMRAKVIEAPATEVHMAAGYPIPDLRHEDIPALDVLGMILGSGDSSRLVQALRLANPVTTEVWAGAYTPTDPGLFMAGFASSPANAEAGLKGLFAEIQRVVDRGVTQAEVAKAREILFAETVFREETVQGQARRLGFYASTTGDPSFDAKYYDRLNQVTPATVKAAAAKYLVPQRLSVALLWPSGDSSDRWDDARLARVVTTAHAPAAVTSKPVAIDDATRQGIETRTLPSGLRVVLQPGGAVPLFAIRAAALGGQRYENEATQGVYGLFGRMLLRGTRRRTTAEIAHELDAIAGSMSGATGRNSVGVQGTFLTKHTERGLSLFFDTLFEPTFPEGELENERAVVLDELAARKDSLSTVAFDHFHRTLFRDHPYGLVASGTEQTVKGFAASQLKALTPHLTRPSDVVVSVVGDFDADQVCDQLESLYGRHSGDAGIAAPKLTAQTRPAKPRAVLAHHDKSQVHLVYGFVTVPMDSPDRPALEVLNAAMAGMGGRLFLELRDKKSLAYTVTSLMMDGIEPGYLAVYMGTSPEKLEAALLGIRRELEKVAESGIMADELERQQRYLTGSFAIGTQRNAARAGHFAFNTLYGLGLEAYTGYAARIRAVTLDDIRRVARAYLQPEHYVLSVNAPTGTGLPASVEQLVAKAGGTVEHVG
jgi:zinc protease